MTEAERKKGFEFLHECIKANTAAAMEVLMERIDALAIVYEWTDEECADVLALLIDAANRSVIDLVEVVEDGAKRGIIL